jgi:hypothetical protein
MDKFDRLNEETQRMRDRFVTRPSSYSNSSPKYGTREYWQNYWNNKTFKSNNGQYSNHY